MTNIPNDDQPGFVAEKPEHCSTCYRLIRPGQTYHMTIGFEMLCEDCALSEGVIRVREDLAVEVTSDRLVIQRGNSEVEVFPNEIRHLATALAEAAVRLVRLVLTVGGTYHKHQTSTEILLQLLQEFIRRYSRLFQYTTQSANGQFAV